jgi:cytochrome subunit of sulfide dehydrogenase
MRGLAVAAVLVAASAPALAQTVAPPGATACSGCHGAPGPNAVVPPLRGRPVEDIVGAMQAFRSGERAATVMDRIAKGFSDEEVRAIATWIAGQR